MESKTLKVSVIMPSYNHGQFIGEAIQSVIDQTYQNWELIIIDNYSKDNTREVIQTFKDKRIQFFSFHNQGIIAASRNEGVRLSTGEILAFLDSDDLWHPDKLAMQLPYLERQTIAAVATHFKPIGQTVYFNNHLNLSRTQPEQLFDFTEMLQTNVIMTSSLMMRKAHFEALRGFDESCDFAFIEDYELWLRLMHDYGQVCVVNRPLLLYRIVKNNGRDQRKIKLNTLKIADKLEKMGYCSHKQRRKFYRAFYLSIGKAHLDVGDHKAMIYYLKAMVWSRTCAKKLTALTGLFLSLLPHRVSLQCTEKLYQLRGRRWQ